MSQREHELRVGISGWTYAPWRGVFYPPGLPHKRELAYAAGQLNSIEINGTFYGRQKPASFVRWRTETPDGFLFSIKGPRYLTHVRRLVDVAQPLANFFASGVLALEEKLGPILWQLPPQLGYDRARVEEFLNLLPHDTKDAARLATGHSEWLAGESWMAVRQERPLRHAIEVRNHSFAVPGFVEQLRRHRVALVFADTAGKWPVIEDVTADFCYARLHGDRQIYASGYTDEAIARWADRFRSWREGGEPADARRIHPAPAEQQLRDLYIYFDNDAKVHAPYDAMALAAMLGLPG